MSDFRTFEDLDCWKACRELRRWVAQILGKLPRDERFRLGDQLVRAARSTTANTAEGYGLFHYAETIHFCRRARGSAYEVLDHLITAVDERFLRESDLAECRQLVEEAVRLLNGFIRYLEQKKTGGAVREARASYLAASDVAEGFASDDPWSGSRSLPPPESSNPRII